MGRHGENIRLRSDGRWEVRVINGSTEDGKTTYKYLFASSYREARELKDFYSQRECGESFSELTTLLKSAIKVFEGQRERVYGEDVPSFQEVALKWLASKRLTVKESSFAHYSKMLERHITPILGDVPIDQVDAETIEDFLLQKRNCGRIKDGGPLSNKTILEIRMLLNQILCFAKSRNILDTVPEMPPVSVGAPTIIILTKKEQRMVERQLREEDTPFSLCVLLALYAGLREGEACAVQWDDFDWNDGTVCISKTVYRVDNMWEEEGPKSKVIIGSPKTLSSTRVVPLPAGIVSYLEKRKENPQYCVSTGTYKCLEPRVCREKFRRFLRRAGVGCHNFHVLRHTYATNCIERGVDLKSLSENMGHSDVRVTLQRYVHPSMEIKKAQVNKLSVFGEDD